MRGRICRGGSGVRGALSTSGRLEWVGVWRVWFAGEMNRLSDREVDREFGGLRWRM